MCFSFGVKSGGWRRGNTLNSDNTKNANDHACNFHLLTQTYAEGFFNDQFVRSLARSLDISHAALKVLVF